MQLISEKKNVFYKWEQSEREKQQKKALLTKKDCEQDEEKWGGQGGTGPGLD